MLHGFLSCVGAGANGGAGPSEPPGEQEGKVLGVPARPAGGVRPHRRRSAAHCAHLRAQVLFILLACLFSGRGFLQAANRTCATVG